MYIYDIDCLMIIEPETASHSNCQELNLFEPSCSLTADRAPVLILQRIEVSEQLSRIKIWWKTHFGFSEKVWNLSKPAGSLPSSSLRGMNFYWLGRNTVSRVHLGCCQRLILLLRRSHIGYIFEGYVLKHIDSDMKTLLFLTQLEKVIIFRLWHFFDTDRRS